ncbi:MAG: DUF488 domain-containing protein [Lachnospiraceae bacterium]|nr:DUF488 domain-containing protein [Lachnospiraceae bacterium]
MNTIYTIGHSQHSIEYFVSLLRKHNIDYIIDVRSTPYSKFSSDYNKDNLQIVLPRYDVCYAHMGKCFGARQDNEKLYTEEGYLDFEKMINSDNYRRGLENVMKGMQQHRIALMCLEKKPVDCHRAIMVANGFYRAGCQVEHILVDGSIQTHEELNEELMNMYFPDRFQLSLFTNNADIDYLSEAYRLRNKDIGYYITERKVV